MIKKNVVNKRVGVTLEESAALHSEALDVTIGSAPVPVTTSPKVYYLDSFLDFGKYKDMRVSWVLERNPDYLIWMYEETQRELDTEVIDQLELRGY